MAFPVFQLRPIFVHAPSISNLMSYREDLFASGAEVGRTGVLKSAVDAKIMTQIMM